MSTTLIKDGVLADDTWEALPAKTAETGPLPAGRFLFPTAIWHTRKNEIISTYKQISIWLEPDTDLEVLIPDLAYFQVIAIHFPKFTDGRGYSLARLLRERHHYEGEIRAVGEVLQDQLFFMKRVGFSAFQLKNSQPVPSALASLNTFSVTYQHAVDQPLPLFRRRPS